MFERYTERARRVLFFGRYEASQYGSISIRSEHLLLGLIREGKGLTSRLFARRHISLESIRAEVADRLVFQERVATHVEIPFDADVKRILQYAADEADRLRHNYIGTEHLLLGILREEQSAAAAVLNERGMTLASVREEIISLLSEKAGLEHRAGEDSNIESTLSGQAAAQRLGDHSIAIGMSKMGGRDLPWHVPAYLPSEIVHISHSRFGVSATGGRWQSPRHWVMIGATLQELVARAFGDDPANEPYPVRLQEGIDATSRYDVVLITSTDESPARQAELVQQAIASQLHIRVTRVTDADHGARLVITPLADPPAGG